MYNFIDFFGDTCPVLTHTKNRNNNHSSHNRWLTHFGQLNCSIVTTECVFVICVCALKILIAVDGRLGGWAWDSSSYCVLAYFVWKTSDFVVWFWILTKNLLSFYNVRLLSSGNNEINNKPPFHCN